MSVPSFPAVDDAAPAPVGVAALVVSHDGQRWLPGVIEGLAEQGPALTRVLAVDTGSRDESAQLLEAAYGEVLRVGSGTAYPAAVRLGLERLALDEQDHEWVWLLHDDSRPAPGALDALLAAAAEHPEVDVLGPKLREWPSLRRLLELGVTISGTGRRETGLERGEYDQGQHDEPRTVLAVHSAGMLVRRRVIEQLGGFDEQLPMFGNDLDFGWRAADAGHTTRVVPEAVVFHAEAAHRGVRRTPLTGRHTHYQERRAALYTLLANSRSRLLPLQVLRLTLGTLLRMLGFVLVRSPGEALDDLAALVSVLSRPGQLRAARRARRAAATADPAHTRSLLAPWWVPYRHGLDFVADLASAASSQASDVAERRRAAAAERDPTSYAARRRSTGVPEHQPGEDDEDDLTDTGLVARFLTSPVAVLAALFVVVSLVGAGVAFGEVSGGALSPVPESAGAWWSLYADGWHPIGQGTPVPGPAYLLPLALLASVLGPSTTVSLLLVLAVPFGLWGAWRLLRVVGRLVSPAGAPGWLVLVAATTYALVPVTSGAWGQGRLGLVVAGALLPWLAHAALGFADPEPDRRWRAAWRTGLLLTLVAAFAPVAWLLAVLVAAGVLVLGVVVARSALGSASVWAPTAVALLVPVVVLAAWWVPALVHGAGAALLLDTGSLPLGAPDGLDLLTGRLGSGPDSDTGAPVALGAVPAVLAALALLPRATRAPVVLCWSVALLTALLGLVLARVHVALVAVETPAGLGLVVLVLQASWITAALIGGQGVLQALGRTARVPRAAALVVALVAAAVPLGGLAWFVVGPDDLGSSADDVVPAYMEQSAVTGDEHGILVVRGVVDTGLTYDVRRGDGVTLGEDEVLALAAEDPALTSTTADLLSRPTTAVVEQLAGLGVEYVLLAAPADGSVAATLDATSGLTQASSDPGSRAWLVDRPLDPGAVDGSGEWWRVVLLVLQGLTLVLALVACAPTVRGRRS